MSAAHFTLMVLTNQKTISYLHEEEKNMRLKGALVTFTDFSPVSNWAMRSVQWNKSIYDTQEICTGTALKVPDGVTAVKLFFQVKWDWDNDPAKSTGFRIAQVRKNGTDDTQLPESRIKAAPGTYTTQNGSTPALLVEAGDLFELWVGQDSGFDIAMFSHQTWFAMEIVEMPGDPDPCPS